MRQRAFEERHHAQWTEFEALLRRAESLRGRRAKLEPDAARAFIDGYRRINRDLAVARARGYGPTLVTHLNELVVRGHNVVYVQRSGLGAALVRFLSGGFARDVRAHAGYVLVSAGLFLMPGALLMIAMTKAPELVYSVMSADQVAQFEAMYDPGAEHFGRERGSDSDFAMFGHYVWNNVTIAFQLFATGLAAGIGTMLYLVFNSVHIGAVAGHLVGIGFGSTFGQFVVAHGAFELTAIVLCGAAGLAVGHAVIAPGPLSRRQALVVRARDAVRIVLGAALMLMIAAFVEAFWSSKALPATAKYVVGSLLWALVLAYFCLAGQSYRGHPRVTGRGRAARAPGH